MSAFASINLDAILAARGLRVVPIRPPLVPDLPPFEAATISRVGDDWPSELLCLPCRLQMLPTITVAEEMTRGGCAVWRCFGCWREVRVVAA